MVPKAIESAGERVDDTKITVLLLLRPCTVNVQVTFRGNCPILVSQAPTIRLSEGCGIEVSGGP